MARPDKIASRYAKAIYDSLGDEAKVRAMVTELESFSSLVAKHQELQRTFAAETVRADERREIVEDLAAKLNLSPTTRRVLTIISNAKRLNILQAISDKLHLVLLQSASVVPMQVVAASHLSPEEREKIEQRFHKILGKKVEASYSVDSGLIGGLRVTAGSRTFDGTLSGWLTTFEEQLVGGTI